MRIAWLVALAVAACSSKTDTATSSGSAGSNSGSAPPAPAPPKDAATAVDAVAALPADAAAIAAAPKVCCCESTGDATHYTIEGEPSACTADDMGGSCVELKECGLDAPPQVLAAGTLVTIDDGGLVAIWKTTEAKAYGAIEIKPAGAHASVRTNASNDEDDHWKKQGRIPTAPGPLTVTAQADGSALISNGKTTWVLQQECRYCPIKMKKQH
ncbi:MAG TPA: hypothetical protein VMJ10_18060 [Kofleriaceae bacterium]|nr:hypothetical protein [Kofleriaceae bacterium]